MFLTEANRIKAIYRIYIAGHKLQLIPQTVPFFFKVEAGICGFRHDRFKMQIDSNLKAEKYTGAVLEET